MHSFCHQDQNDTSVKNYFEKSKHLFQHKLYFSIEENRPKFYNFTPKAENVCKIKWSKRGITLFCFFNLLSITLIMCYLWPSIEPTQRCVCVNKCILKREFLQYSGICLISFKCLITISSFHISGWTCLTWCLQYKDLPVTLELPFINQYVVVFHIVSLSSSRRITASLHVRFYCSPERRYSV